MKALKFLFVKKLSTGYDEEQTHNSLLKKLEKNIKDNTLMLQSKETEFKNLKQERQQNNINKNQEITDLKDELESLKKQ